MKLRETAIDLLKEGVKAADPGKVVRRAVSVDDNNITINGYKINKSEYKKTYLLGIGKASVPMADALLELVPIDKGVVITNDDQAPQSLGSVEVFRGSHPHPSGMNLQAARRVVELAKEADGETLVVFLVSGGGSALYSLPVDELELKNLVAINRLLLSSGASIDEINAVRKHLSAVKGGRTALVAKPARVVSLILSDVVGDDMGTIASGPTVRDPSNFAVGKEILQNYDIWNDLPHSVQTIFRKGVAGKRDETLKKVLPNVHNFLVGDNMTALNRVKVESESRGYNALILSSMIEGEASVAGKVHGGIAREIEKTGNPIVPPAVVISGGEVTVKGVEKGGAAGGPNREFLLGAATEIKGRSKVLVGAIDTDGVDGNAGSGALAFGDTVEKLSKSPSYYLKRHLSGEAFDELGNTIDFGKTGTNVNDLRIIIVAKG